MVNPGPGPIKKVAQTIKSNMQARKDEKQRAAEKGYKYNRNEVHDAGEGKVRNLKGSVGAVIGQEANRAKQNVKAKVGAAKKAVEAKVDKMQESRETRKAMNAGKKKLNEEKVKGDNKLGPIHMTGSKLRSPGDKKGPEAKATAKKSTVKGKNILQKAQNKMAYSKGVKRSYKAGKNV
jgi:hypothetical protein